MIGAGVTGLVAGHRLAEAGHVADLYERWPGLGGQAATLDVGPGPPARALLPPPLHERPPYRRAVRRARDARRARVAAVECRVLHRRQVVAVQRTARPAALPPALARASRLRMGIAVVLLQRRGRDVRPFENETAREWVNRAMGAEAWQKVWGPLLQGKFGDRASDISMAWLWNKLTARRQIKGEEARQELLGYPRGSWETLYERLKESIESRGGRVMIDRPARRLARDDDSFLVAPAAPDAFRAGHDPRRFPSGGDPERYDAVIATVPNDIFTQLLDADLARAIGPDYLGRPRLDRVPHGAVPAARARPAVHALLLDQHRRRRDPVRRPGRAHELHRALAVRRQALPVRRQLLRGRPRHARPGHRGSARRLRAGPAKGQPGVLTRAGSRSAGSSASRPPSRS